MLSTYICHADWGSAANKRWLSRATLGSDGSYSAHAPTSIENRGDLIPSIRKHIRNDECALVGFDFPIGIPAAYACLAGVTEFRTFLRNLGHGDWVDFYRVAVMPSEISLHRPFFPFSPGGKKQAHLLNALGIEEIDDLRRKCERKHSGRKAACPLFWTLGASQVGKAAIVGWRDVLVPALENDSHVLIWPFDGDLNSLLLPGNIVVVETYPAECYGWFLPEPLRGKGKLEVRRAVGGHLTKWAASLALAPEPSLLYMIERGFPEGDDAFDAVVGLMGMIEVVTGRRKPGEPSEDRIGRLEGWILGQVPMDKSCKTG
jgi:hypothetical protein